MSIVTKTGDKGETGLLKGLRLKKTDPRLELIGEIDELAANLGLVSNQGLKPEIERIQADLFELGALVAGAEGDMNTPLNRIESELAELEPTFPPLQNFILPGGCPEAARLHLARAVCRRTERSLVAIENRPENALPYLNRLSDYLFLLARSANYRSNTKEALWKKV